MKKREIRRPECIVCKGVGTIPKKSKKRCDKCDGKGWTESGLTEEICSKCKGNGVINITTHKTCSCCDGKGYSVQIFEIKTSRKKCECRKKGYKPEYSTCLACEGTGTDKKYKVCHLCKGKEVYQGWECSNCQGTGIEVRGNEEIHQEEEVVCYTCEGTGESNECTICNGMGVVVTKSETEITPEQQ